MLKVGLVGWRGMVGSVLMERMKSENDFNRFEPFFYSTSQAGQNGPDIGKGSTVLLDAYDIKMLSGMDIIITCQGSSYTNKFYSMLKASGWNGYWIDAASAMRMEKDSVIVLDPVNLDVIKSALVSDVKNYIGGNCTVSLMLMAVGGLFKKGYIEWISSMTYQAASGAGAKNMRELVAQMSELGKASKSLLEDFSSSILDLDKLVLKTMHNRDFPVDNFSVPLAGSVIPWIDIPVESGQSREEWKGFAETNKILQNKTPIPIDGICVRVGLMRCHSQALTIKLKSDIPIDEISEIISEANSWTRVIANIKEETIQHLTPAAVTGKLEIPVGRIRKLNIGPKYLTLFTVGDQLLWGAAEPIRRMLGLVIDYLE